MTTASDRTRVRPVVGVDELELLLASNSPPTLLDVRWALDAPEGRPAYLRAHLDGAVYVDLERELSAPGFPERGRHPLPDHRALADAVRRWGVRAGDTVVAYDDNDGVAAARAWWLLGSAGINVRVLDGGLRAWVREGLELHSGDVAPAIGDAVLLETDAGAVTIEEAARAPRRGTPIDARGPQHYRGSLPGIDPVSGHIPGAINVPTVSYLTPEGILRSPEGIRAILLAAGVDVDRPIVVTCSSGLASAHTLLTLATAGIDAFIFPGGWSQWSRASGRPVALGSLPEGEGFGDYGWAGMGG